MLITCPIHGDFYQLPMSHIHGKGCSKCGDLSTAYKQAYTTEEFINKSKQIHGNKYDYSNVHYISNKYKVIIECPIHGNFLQSTDKHLNGHGCPKCVLYKLENTISLLLDNNNIKYNKNYKEFKWLINDINHSLELDFYIPEYNIAIECQGKQHFEPVEKFGGNEAY